MAVSGIKVCSHIYQKVMRTQLKLIDLGLIGPTTKFQLSYIGGCQSGYTTMVGKTKDTYRVVIGGRLIANVTHLPERFTSKTALKPYIKPIKVMFMAINYHEMGHVLFTDMTFAPLLGYDPKYRGFLFQLENIIEDPIVELNIIKYVEKTHPYDKSPRGYIEYMKHQMFDYQCDEYKDKGDITSFLQYLLLSLRCGATAIKGTNAVYEKYKDELVPRIKAALTEPDATVRQAKDVELADWIINNIKEFDWTTPKMPEDIKPKIGGGAPSGSPMPSSVGEDDMPSGFSGGGHSSSAGEPGGGGHGGHAEGKEEEDDEDDKDDEDKEGSGSAGEPDDEDDDGEDKTSSHESHTEPPEDDTCPDMDEVFEDLINSSYDHEFVIAKDEYEIHNPDALEHALNEQIDQSKDCVQNISKFLTLFKGRKKPRRTGGFTSGKLNVPAAMQDEARDGCETKLFCRNVQRGKMVDLAVSLVCDNSGSMSGERSKLASIAALALAQACDWAKVPFECSCFTKTSDSPTGTSITIIEKELDETFEKAKPYFGINDSQLIRYLKSERDIPTFGGNSEEVNLFHIGNNFARCKHDTKLMFVFCDGGTTGSEDSLRQVIKKMMKDGIHVIGIGLQCREVANLYPYHKLFNSYEEMQTELAPYLVDTLSEFATK